jgi:iron complex outermembrane receptor protein
MRVVVVAVCGLLMPFAAVAQVVTPVAETTTSTATSEPQGRDKDYVQVSIEDMLNRDIAVAATKTRVDVAKAPASVSVLTPEDIRRSGATNLGELLRQVPGLDVLEAFPGYISVSARGTSASFVNSMLVLIDGRRFETLLAGVPFLDEMAVRMEDIKRIEVVKGPVGALYGTNAIAGVISITTYGASEVNGTFASFTGGMRDTMDATLRQAGHLGHSSWSYKFTGGYSYTHTWGSLDSGYTLPPIAVRKGSGLLLLERRFADNSTLEIEGGLAKGDLASLTTVTNQTQYFTHPHARIGYSRADFHVLLTSSPQSLELRERVPPIQPLTDKWSEATNLSIDRTVRPFESSTVTVGGNLRHQRSNFTSIATTHNQVVGSVFAQDEQSIVRDRLTVFGAVGLNHHPELDTQVDGNAAVVATPVKGHTFRVSFGRAHRDPSFIENYTNFRRQIAGQDGYQTSNIGLDPATIKSWEAGYHGRVSLGHSSRILFFAEGFTEHLRNLIGIVTTPVAKGSVPQYPTVTIVQQFRNIEARNGKGFETGAELETSGLDLVGQYSYQDFHNAVTGAPIQSDIPKHKVSGGLRTHAGALELDLWVHSVSRSVSRTVSASTDEDGYVLVNPRVGVRAGRHWMLAAEAFNALNDKHMETANGRGIKGEKVGRLVTFNLRYTP